VGGNLSDQGADAPSDSTGLPFGIALAASGTAAAARDYEKMLLGDVLRRLNAFLADPANRNLGAHFRADQVDLLNARSLGRILEQIGKRAVFLDVAFSGLDVLEGRAGVSKVAIAVAGVGLVAVSAPASLGLGAALLVLDVVGALDPATLAIDRFVVERIRTYSD
jgi:hypothetical protein